MKTFLITILFFAALFSSCSNIDPVVSDVCSITEEICYYANLVCENFNKENSENIIDENEKTKLQQIVNDLKYEAMFTSNNFSNKNPIHTSEVKYRLIQIRNELKKIYEEKKKE